MFSNDISIEEKVGQLFFIGIAGPELDAATSDLLDEVKPGGVCLFTRNIREAAQTRDLTDSLRANSTSPLLISIDQEGGLVDRLRRLMTAMPAARKLRSPADAAELATIISETLQLLGLNMDFAPVVDVIDHERAKYDNGLFSREFGRSKEDVVEFAGAFLRSLQENGIVGCLKHFPGLGSSRVDSHEDLPNVDLSEKELFSTDLYPYEKLLGDARAVMVAHACYPQLPLQETDQNGKLLPSSLSFNFITKLLCERLGFTGLVITDDLEMGAIIRNYGIGDACVMAINAGGDMLSICADPDRIRDGFGAVLQAVQDGSITEDRLDESLARIAHIKKAAATTKLFSAERLKDLSERTSVLNARLG